MGERAEKEAFVTLATNDTYALGCLVLGNSLRRVETTRKLVVMVTDGVTQSMRNQLGRVFDLINEVEVFDSNDAVNLQLLGRPDLSCTLTKINCWRLTQFNKCVFMDADTLVLQNVDELFDRDELSAAPDAGWPDCFNSGIFVLVPSLETYCALVQFALTQGTFDGGDQGLLNLYFQDWATKDIAKHLPFIYNVVSQAFYSYLPAFTQFKDRVKIVHFIGAVKPWHHAFNTATGQVMPLPGTGHSQEFLQIWWNLFMQTVQPTLDPCVNISSGGLVGQLASLEIEGGVGRTGDMVFLDDRERKLAWERGQMDYLGVDKFDNIMKKITQEIGDERSPSPSKGGTPPPSQDLGDEVEVAPPLEGTEVPPEGTEVPPESTAEIAPSSGN
ncbi:glycogenin-1-like isoform X2 [Haliotis rubra]|uniref:glycogenin-1-like isoform X2 n=1 Tax=Haliotis rubra TaxID=36100 RepID=UPI001EE5E2B2|nr:glycogenin-1-like isoform X2 [Haliotis rubra]